MLPPGTFSGLLIYQNAFTAERPSWTTLWELSVLQIFYQSLQRCPRPYLLFVAIFKHCWLTTRSWKNVSGGLGIPGIFCNQDCWNLVLNLLFSLLIQPYLFVQIIFQINRPSKRLIHFWQCCAFQQERLINHSLHAVTLRQGGSISLRSLTTFC